MRGEIRVIDGHVCCVGRIAIDEGITAIALRYLRPGAIGSPKLCSIVLRPARHVLAIRRVQSHADKLGRVVRGVVQVNPVGASIGRLPNAAIICRVNNVLI